MREFKLLKHVYAASAGDTPRVAIGPGDDMAMIRVDDRDLLVAVDQVVAGRHVDLDQAPLALVGRKAVTRSLSDIAAMGARPLAALVAVVLPPDFGADRATGLFDAMRETAEAFDAPLVGGDIAFHASASDPLTCSVTVLATPGPAGAVRRGGAAAGDAVYVTGRLGGSLASGRHLTFTPRIREALTLAETLGDRLHAMIDLSDGLGRDAAHIAEASGVAIEIDAGAIPRHDGLDWRRAAGDGEDYELLFTTAEPSLEATPGSTSFTLGDDVPVTRIGRVVTRATPATPLVTFVDGAERTDGATLGWEHGS